MCAIIVSYEASKAGVAEETPSGRVAMAIGPRGAASAIFEGETDSWSREIADDFPGVA